jgi:hypothetical protein
MIAPADSLSFESGIVSVKERGDFKQIAAGFKIVLIEDLSGSEHG